MKRAKRKPTDVKACDECELYRTGHNVHVMQALKGGNDRSTPPVPARLVEFLDDGTFIIESGGKEVHLWNHNPDALRAHFEKRVPAGYQSRWNLIYFDSDDGWLMFSVTSGAERESCDPDLVDHGFLIDVGEGEEEDVALQIMNWVSELKSEAGKTRGRRKKTK